MAIIYLDIDLAKKIHANTVSISGGGSSGLLDDSLLRSVLEHIQNDDYYPSFEEKLTHLFFGVCKFHCFQDGNKRAAIALSAHMLILNGFLFSSSLFIREMENISYHVASGAINKDLLLEIIKCLLNEDALNESVMLKIFNAIENAN